MGNHLAWASMNVADESRFPTLVGYGWLRAEFTTWRTTCALDALHPFQTTDIAPSAQ